MIVVVDYGAGNLRSVEKAIRSLGHAVQVREALNSSVSGNTFDRYLSYDAAGHVAKQWQSYQDSEGLRSAVSLFGYDKNGQQTSTTTLSELQLFTCAIQAMAKLSTGKNRQGYTTTDMAYAAMGLLSYRISPNPSDSAFQAIARLSLVNDSNLLLERLVCLWPFENTQKQLQAQLDVKDNVAGSATI